jgi:hypothetical protein
MSYGWHPGALFTPWGCPVHAPLKHFRATLLNCLKCVISYNDPFLNQTLWNYVNFSVLIWCDEKCTILLPFLRDSVDEPALIETPPQPAFHKFWQKHCMYGSFIYFSDLILSLYMYDNHGSAHIYQAHLPYRIMKIPGHELQPPWNQASWLYYVSAVW